MAGSATYVMRALATERHAEIAGATGKDADLSVRAITALGTVLPGIPFIDADNRIFRREIAHAATGARRAFARRREAAGRLGAVGAHIGRAGFEHARSARIADLPSGACAAGAATAIVAARSRIGAIWRATITLMADFARRASSRRTAAMTASANPTAAVRVDRTGVAGVDTGARTISANAATTLGICLAGDIRHEATTGARNAGAAAAVGIHGAGCAGFTTWPARAAAAIAAANPALADRRAADPAKTDLAALAGAICAAALPVDAAITATVAVREARRSRGGAKADATFAGAAAALAVTAAGRACRLAGANAIDARAAATADIVGAGNAIFGADAADVAGVADIAATLVVCRAAIACRAAITGILGGAVP